MRVILIDRAGKRHEIEGTQGETLLTLAQKSGLDMEGTCEGNMSCATCHVYIQPGWEGRLSPMTNEESSVLDLAPGVTPYSRLACQIKLTEQFDGLVVSLA